MAECADRIMDIALYAGGELEDEAAVELERHLDVCPSCRAEVEAMRKSIELTGKAGMKAPPLDEFMDGVRRMRMQRAARVKRILFGGAAAVLLVAIVAALVLPVFLRTEPVERRLAESSPVEVERVGYDEAVVRIVSIKDKPMTVVWIVSEEVASESERRGGN